MSPSKAEMTRLLGGKPKKVTRGTAKRIIELADALNKTGLCEFPYYSKDAPEDYTAFRGSDTRKMLEREIARGFWYTTGNWDHLNEGRDTMVITTDEETAKVLSDAGFRVRWHDSNVADSDEDEDGDN